MYLVFCHSWVKPEGKSNGNTKPPLTAWHSCSKLLITLISCVLCLLYGNTKQQSLQQFTGRCYCVGEKFNCSVTALSAFREQKGTIITCPKWFLVILNHSSGSESSSTHLYRAGLFYSSCWTPCRLIHMAWLNCPNVRDQTKGRAFSHCSRFLPLSLLINDWSLPIDKWL